MDMNSTIASRFYRDVQGALRPGEGQSQGPKGPGEAAADAAGSFITALRQAETTSEAGMVGKADPQSVVTAMASAELAVQSAVAIRDRVVESYQEILRMPV